MKEVFNKLVATVVLTVGLAAPASAREGLPTVCTFEWEPKIYGFQLGSGLWLRYSVQTILKLPPCQIGAFAEGWVAGASNSFLRHEGVFSANASKDVRVPYADTWTVEGRHSRGSIVGEIYLGSNSVSVRVEEPEPELTDGGDTEDPRDITGNPLDPDSACPLLIDVDGNGVKLTSAEQGVIFDIDGDGQAEQIGWTHKNSNDVWLAMDRNGNGRIDDGTELFGNNTRVRAGQTTDNGFEALNFLHSESLGLAALDQSITGSDTAWDRLLLWRDANHNGISEPDELTRVVDSPLSWIDLRYEVVSRVQKANEVRERSTVLWNGATRPIVDVWLTILR
jgi:hypothetical protein